MGLAPTLGSLKGGHRCNSLLKCLPVVSLCTSGFPLNGSWILRGGDPRKYSESKTEVVSPQSQHSTTVSQLQVSHYDQFILKKEVN